MTTAVHVLEGTSFLRLKNFDDLTFSVVSYFTAVDQDEFSDLRNRALEIESALCYDLYGPDEDGALAIVVTLTDGRAEVVTLE